MKIPDSVRIAGVEYPVTLVEHLNDGMNALYGRFDPADCKIELSNPPRQSHQKRCITLLHEIFHGIIHHACLEINEKDEERVVEVLSFGMYQVLQDNGRRLFDIVPVQAGVSGQEGDGPF